MLVGVKRSENQTSTFDKVFSSHFRTFIVEFCRDRRLRAFFKKIKILASSPFSFPCLSQILSSTPVLIVDVVVEVDGEYVVVVVNVVEEDGEFVVVLWVRLV